MSKTINLSNNTKSYINKIVSATEELKENLTELQAFSDGFVDLLDEKANIEASIEEAKVKAKEEVRAQKVQMNLDIKANKEAALNGLAQDLNVKVIEEDNYKELLLKAELNQDEVNKLIDTEKARAKRQLEAALKSQKLEHVAATAKLEAKVESLSDGIHRKDAEISQLRDQIKELNEVLKVASTKGSVTQTIGKV